MRKQISIVFVLLALLAISGCINMPTPANSVVVVDAPTTRFDGLDCKTLALEVGKQTAAVRELSAAQDARRKSSVGHLVFYGWGQGDGMETIELAKTRGELQSLVKARDKKGCPPT